jgi:hypothetical protein
LATRAAALSQLALLSFTGLDQPTIDALVAWRRAKRVVTLRFRSTGRCVYKRSVKRELESAVQDVRGDLSRTKHITTIGERAALHMMHMMVYHIQCSTSLTLYHLHWTY